MRQQGEDHHDPQTPDIQPALEGLRPWEQRACCMFQSMPELSINPPKKVEVLDRSHFHVIRANKHLPVQIGYRDLPGMGGPDWHSLVL
jgi:hypothetical protein